MFRIATAYLSAYLRVELSGLSAMLTMVSELCREDQMGGLRTGIRPVHISPISKMVSDYSGMMVQPHKAIVGANAFAHESGIHQDGMLKSRDTYEIMRPETIGLQRQDQAGTILRCRSPCNCVCKRRVCKVASFVTADGSNVAGI